MPSQPHRRRPSTLREFRRHSRETSQPFSISQRRIRGNGLALPGKIRAGLFGPTFALDASANLAMRQPGHPGVGARVDEPAQPLARVAHQRIDQDLLWSALGEPGRDRAGLAGNPARLPKRLPVRRAVARPENEAAIHERFGNQHRMSMRGAEVVGQPANVQPHHPRSEVRRGAPGQDGEPRVVGNQVKAANLLLGQPLDLPVTNLELERTGVPADEREPMLVEHLDLAHVAPHQSPDRHILVRVSQRIPPAPLAGGHCRTDRELAQMSRNRIELRLRRSRGTWAPAGRYRSALSSEPGSHRTSNRCRPRWFGPAILPRPTFAHAKPLTASAANWLNERDPTVPENNYVPNEIP